MNNQGLYFKQLMLWLTIYSFVVLKNRTVPELRPEEVILMFSTYVSK